MASRASLLLVTGIPVDPFMPWRESAGDAMLGPLLLPRPHDQQDDPSGQCEPSKDWGNGNSFVSFRRNVRRSQIENFFLTCVVDALVGESQCAQNNQQNSNPTDRFHVCILRLDNSSTLNEPDYENNEGQDQQDVDESTHRVGSGKSQQPQYKQDYKKCPKHNFLPSEPISRFFILCLNKPG